MKKLIEFIESQTWEITELCFVHVFLALFCPEVISKRNYRLNSKCGHTMINRYHI